MVPPDIKAFELRLTIKIRLLNPFNNGLELVKGGIWAYVMDLDHTIWPLMGL